MSFLSRCVDRFASAFVTETVTDDGTRLLLALDPTLHGLDLVVVVGQAPPADHLDGPEWPEWRDRPAAGSCPADARSLF